MKIRNTGAISPWICIIIAAMYKPAFIDNLPYLDLLWNGVRAVVLMGVVVNCLPIIKSGKIKKYMFAVFIWGFSLLICTVIHRGSLTNYILSIGMGLGIIISAETELTRNAYRFIHSVAIMLGCFIIINFITIILFPDGFYIVNNYAEINGITMIKDQVPCYFLGFRNVMFTTIFPGIVINILDYNMMKKKSIISIISIACGVASFLILWSATSITVSFIFILVYIISKKIEPKVLINTIYVIAIVFFIAIVLLRLQNLFSFIIVGILKKDLTFTNRVGIWDKAIKLIMTHPFIGYGYREHQYYIDTIGASHAHNYYLDVWMRGGFVAFASFIYMIKGCGDRLRKCPKSKNQIALIAMLWSILIAFETEAYISAINLFIFIPLAMHCNELTRNNLT